MSKTFRWSLYGTLIAGAVIFGYMVTFNQDPESYLPTPDAPLTERSPTAGGAPGGAWEIEVEGELLSLEERGEELRLMLEVGSIDGEGIRPLLDRRVEARVGRKYFEELPEPGDSIRFTSRGSRQRPAFLEISGEMPE